MSVYVMAGKKAQNGSFEAQQNCSISDSIFE